MRPAPTRGSKRGAPGSVLAGSPPAPTRALLCHCRCSRLLPRRAPRLLSGVLRRLLRLGRRGPAERWKAQGVKVEPNFTAGGTRGRGDACAPGAGCRADGAALGGLPGGGAPLRPPRQWRPHECAHQRIIASRDISADTHPARGRGEGSARLPPPWVTRTSRLGYCASAPRHLRGTPLLAPMSRSPGPQCHPRAGTSWHSALRRQRWLDTKRACCPSPRLVPLFPLTNLEPQLSPARPRRTPPPGNFSSQVPTQGASRTHLPLRPLQVPGSPPSGLP